MEVSGSSGGGVHVSKRGVRVGVPEKKPIIDHEQMIIDVYHA